MKKGWQQLWTVVQVITRKLKTDESAYLHCILRETGEPDGFSFPEPQCGFYSAQVFTMTKGKVNGDGKDF